MNADPALSVTVRLCGGLGNQLFQYAFARALALRSQARLLLDPITGFVGDRYRRSFCLQGFSHAGELLGGAGIKSPLARLIRRLGRRARLAADALRAPDQRRILMDPPAASGAVVAPFVPAMVGLRVSHPVVVEGYWQSERYFRDVAARIRADLVMPGRLAPPDAVLADRIQACLCPIGLHVRRHRVSRARDDLQVPVSFYRSAVAELVRGAPAATVYVFADDHAWAKAHLDLPSRVPVVHVDHNDEAAALGDFALLRRCRHFVVSNSTFAWWAAWLGSHPDKTVIAPRGFYHRDDMVPEEWRLL